MHLLGRSTQPADLDTCVALVRDRFLYEEADFRDLREMWLEFITHDTGRSAVLFEAGAPDRVLGFGMSVAVSASRYRAIIENREPFLGKALLDEWRRGEKPFLDEAAFAAANANGGLHFVVIHNGVSETVGVQNLPMALSAMSEAFMSMHRGCNLQAVLHESFGVPAAFAIDLGMRVTEHAEQYAGRLKDIPIDRMPTMIVSMSREQAQDHPGHLVMSQLFLRVTAPLCGLRTPERRLLRFALEGTPDERIADILGIAPRTLKKRWADVYAAMEPVTGAAPGLGNGQRGTEIRRHVLRYVREHPEELHGYARTLEAMSGERAYSQR